MRITTEVRNGCKKGRSLDAYFLQYDNFKKDILIVKNLGFCIGRPVAQRPTAAQSRLSAVFWLASSGKSTYIHKSAWECKIDNGEFEFIYHFNNHFNLFLFFLLLHVAK